jgi:hypothetical protein
MKIAASTVAMHAEHLALQRQETRESLRVWVGRRPVAEPDRVRFSDTGKTRHASETRGAREAEAAEYDPRLLLIKRMVELLTGKEIRILRVEAAAEAAPAEVTDGPPSSGSASSGTSTGFGIEYDYHSVREEAETTHFSTQGVVRTADGREIAFSLELDMSRYYREEVAVSFRAGDAARKDPLVINFDGNAAQLTDQRFLFDLDADGDQDSIAMLAAGSGYLAFDKNGNGAIDSGAELFGPATGSGFAELAAYDADGNGWIDEGDGIWSQLRVWNPATDGAGALDTLSAHDVGALFLGEVATPFELRGARNADLGAVATTGLYLGEDGQAGTLQEIDLSV